MTTIRDRRRRDAADVGRLISRTYAAFNLGFAPPEQQAGLLGPLRFAESDEPAQQTAIAAVIAAPVVLVAADEGAIVGVSRGGRLDRKGRTILQSLFVGADHPREGVGRRLVTRFAQACRAEGATVVAVASTLCAVPFSRALGDERSTGVRSMRSFPGRGLPYQPMKEPGVIPARRCRRRWVPGCLS